MQTYRDGINALGGYPEFEDKINAINGKLRVTDIFGNVVTRK